LKLFDKKRLQHSHLGEDHRPTVLGRPPRLAAPVITVKIPWRGAFLLAASH